MDDLTSKLGDMEFPFGKFGPQPDEDACPIWYAADEDPKYCDWFINNTEDSIFRKALQRYMKVKYPHGH